MLKSWALVEIKCNFDTQFYYPNYNSKLNNPKL